jgi:hypothetical protein
MCRVSGHGNGSGAGTGFRGAGGHRFADWFGRACGRLPGGFQDAGGREGVPQPSIEVPGRFPVYKPADRPGLPFVPCSRSSMSRGRVRLPVRLPKETLDEGRQATGTGRDAASGPERVAQDGPEPGIRSSSPFRVGLASSANRFRRVSSVQVRADPGAEERRGDMPEGGGGDKGGGMPEGGKEYGERKKDGEPGRRGKLEGVCLHPL